MTVLDYAVIVAFILGMLGIGVYYARQIRSAEDYLLGGRQIPSLMIGLSLFATFNSTLSYLALPGEMIKNGPVIFSEYLSFPLVMVIVGWFLIPRIMQAKAASGYELLEQRLGLTGRLLGATMFILLRIFWMATILYATCSAVLIPLLNLDPSWLPAFSLTLGILTLIYTASGGLKAVVVTDAIQALLMFLGAILSIAIITYELGGFSAWWPARWPEHWPEVAVLPSTGKSRTILGAFMAMLVWMTCTAGSDQMSVQRYLATRNMFAARRAFGIQLISNMASGMLLALAGLAVLAYFQQRPDLLKPGWSITTHADKLLPHFLIIGLPPGITGLALAAIMAAAMSSLSSGLNSTSAVIVSDYLRRVLGHTPTPSEEVALARRTSVVVAAVAIGLSLLVGNLASNLLELCFKVVNLLTAPIFVLFFLALFVPGSGPRTAIVATLCSVTTAVLLAFGWNAQWFLWSPPGALAMGIASGVTASIAGLDQRRSQDQENA